MTAKTAPNEKAVKTKVKRNKTSLSKTVVKNRRVREKLKNRMTIR